MNTIFESPASEASVKKMPYSYRQQIRKKSCIDAVCEVSGLKLKQLKNKQKEYSGMTLSFSKMMRNILIEMLIKSAWMNYTDVGEVVGLECAMVERIHNSEKSVHQKKIQQECFEKYCQLMVERTKPCLFSKYETVSVYRNVDADGFDLKEVSVNN